MPAGRNSAARGTCQSRSAVDYDRRGSRHRAFPVATERLRGDGAAGYLREGTGLGNRDVWPGLWSVEKNHAFGANVRLGYAPGGVLGEGGSVYFVTGVHWLRATVRRGSDIGTESIRNVADHTLRPWVAGAGVEWGSSANRVGVEVRYAAADLEFRTGGDGLAIAMPRIDHAFALREVSVQVGYTRSF